MPAIGTRLVVGHGRRSLAIAEEQKKPLVFLFSLQGFFFKLKKKNLMVSLSYVRKICYFGVLLVQIVLP